MISDVVDKSSFTSVAEKTSFTPVADAKAEGVESKDKRLMKDYNWNQQQISR